MRRTNWRVLALIPTASNSPKDAAPHSRPSEHATKITETRAPLDRTSRRALLLPAVCALSLLALVAYSPVHSNPRLFWTFVATSAILLAWTAALALSRPQRSFALDVMLRPQHYVQACAHTSILLYWGWFWRPVYDYAYLIVAQLLFAFAFDALLTWSREDRFTLGVGPFPIVFSTNLFLWFKNDWFYLQFLMLVVGFAAKALLRWNRDGRQVHIFNPSAFMLTVLSLSLLATGNSDMTWGQDIAVTQFFPPNMYLFLFLVALPGQLLFGVTTMTMSAVLTTYGSGLAYFAVTGTYYFYDSYIPIAVFLGMHLLFTDPATAPRTEGGRIVFGAMYGLSTVGLYAWLGAAGLPTFYDKLLQVPLMNLSVKAIDWVFRSTWIRAFDLSRAWPTVVGRRRYLAYVCTWATVFIAMTIVQGVGDRHPGQWLPFWQGACDDRRDGACSHLSQMYETYCRAGSPWACREFDAMDATGIASESAAAMSTTASTATRWAGRPLPPVSELPILLRGSKAPVLDREPVSLRARACAQGWLDACAPVADQAARAGH